MSILRDLAVGARVRLYSKLKRHPRIFLPVAKRRENYKKRAVHQGSELVIEAFTRCGSHPALYTFLVAQGRTVDVAHHFHAPAPLMLAAKWGVPALLLVRDPLQAVASAAMYFDVPNPHPFLHSYIDFHEPLVDVVEKLVVSDFPQTVRNFRDVVDAVNRQFGCQFLLPTGSAEERAEVERRIRQEHTDNMGSVPTTLPLPTAQKEGIKNRIIERMSSRRYARALAECQVLHRYFAERSVGAAVGCEFRPKPALPGSAANRNA